MDSFEQIVSVARAVTSDLSKYSEELEHIATIKAQFDHAESWKKQQEQEIADALKGLSRQLEVIKVQTEIAENEAEPDSEVDPQLLLEREKFALARSINQLQTENRQLELQLTTLRQELAELSAIPLPKFDQDILKLKIYRSLGVYFKSFGEEASCTKSPFQKIIIRNEKRGEFLIMDIDQNISDFQYANSLWEACGE